MLDSDRTFNLIGPFERSKSQLFSKGIMKKINCLFGVTQKRITIDTINYYYLVYKHFLNIIIFLNLLTLIQLFIDISNVWYIFFYFFKFCTHILVRSKSLNIFKFLISCIYKNLNISKIHWYNFFLSSNSDKT